MLVQRKIMLSKAKWKLEETSNNFILVEIMENPKYIKRYEIIKEI